MLRSLCCRCGSPSREVEQAIYDSYAMSPFMGLDFTVEQVPEATTLLHSRHLLEKPERGQKLFARQQEIQQEIFDQHGWIMRGGSIGTPRSSPRRLQRRTPRALGTPRCIRRGRATSGTSG